jgi:hypothetical protein
MGWVVNTTPRPLYPRERAGNHCIGWVGPRAGLDGCAKLAPLGLDPRTVQPVAIRYTDRAIAAPSYHKDGLKGNRIITKRIIYNN